MTSAIDARSGSGCHGQPAAIEPSGSSVTTRNVWLTVSISVTSARPSSRNLTSRIAFAVRYGQPAAEAEGLGEGDGAGEGEVPGNGLADGVVEAADDADASCDRGDGATLGAGLHPTIVSVSATTVTPREPLHRCAIVRTRDGVGDHAPAAGRM